MEEEEASEVSDKVEEELGGLVLLHPTKLIIDSNEKVYCTGNSTKATQRVCCLALEGGAV